MSNKAHAYTSASSPRITRGFTIVELLIVIVVIAILAAISIVAYRGIQDRANSSAASAKLTQAAKQVQLYYAEHATYPTSLSLLTDLPNTQDYGYTTNADNSTYCLTATVSNKSYYLNTTTHTTPTPGGCPGHGQGGVVAVTNYIVNPNFDGSGAMGPGWAAYSHGTASVVRNLSGNEQTITVTSLVGGFRRAGIRQAPPIEVGTISPNMKYVSGRVTLDTSGLGSGTRVRLLTDMSNNGTWVMDRSAATTTVSGSLDLILPPSLITTQVTRITPYVWIEATTGSDWTGSSVIKVSKMSVYLTDSSSFSPVYYDGNSPNWVWNDVPNNSTSTGPAL